MSLLHRFGTSRQAEVLCLTIHTINVVLPESCLIKLVIRLDSSTKVSTSYTRYDPTYPVTAVESVHSLQVDFFQRKLKTLKKTVKMTLVTLQDIKEVENGRAELEVQNLSVGGPGLGRTLVSLKKCSDAQGSLCISVSRKLASTVSTEKDDEAKGKKGDEQQQGEEIEGRKRQSTLIPLPVSALSPFPQADKLESSSSEDEDEEPIIVRRFATVSSSSTVPVQARRSYEHKPIESSSESDSSSSDLEAAEAPKNHSPEASPVRLSLNLTGQKLASATAQHLLASILPAKLAASPPTEESKRLPSPEKKPAFLSSVPVTALKTAPPNARSNPERFKDAGRSRTAACAGCSLQ